METINGCTVFPPPGTPEPISLGPAETQGSYVALVGLFPSGHTVWNSGKDSIRGLILVSPGDAEHVFEPAD
jgi:hypothetical protein